MIGLSQGNEKSNVSTADMLKRLGSRQSSLTGLKDAEEGPSVLLIESEQSCDSMVRRSRKAFLTKACDDDLPKSVDTLEQHFADLTGRQTYFHIDERAAGSPQSRLLGRSPRSHRAGA